MKGIWILFTMLIIGCTQRKENYDHTRASVTNKLRHQVALQLKKERNLHACGTGGGGRDKIRMLYLAFDYYQQSSIEEARELFISAGNLFLKTINEDENIRRYLINYPFQPKNIEMAIFFKKSDGSDVDSQHLCLVSLGDGKLRYDTHDPETYHLVSLFTETYEEAAEKLKASDKLLKEMENTNEMDLDSILYADNRMHSKKRKL